jgi:hypothetical protein
MRATTGELGDLFLEQAGEESAARSTAAISRQVGATMKLFRKASQSG